MRILPVIAEVSWLEIGDVQNIFVAFRVHCSTVGGIQKEWVLIPHHLKQEVEQIYVNFLIIFEKRFLMFS